MLTDEEIYLARLEWEMEEQENEIYEQQEYTTTDCDMAGNE